MPNRLAVVLMAFAATVALAELPELQAQLDAIEQQAELLRAGDRATANSLVLKVNGVRTEFGKLRNRDAAWKAQVDRSTALIDRIRAKGLAASTGEAPAAGAEVAMGSIDRHYFEEYQKVAERYQEELAAIDPIAAIDRISLKGAAQQMRSALERVGDQQHPQVVAARASIDQFEVKLAEKVAAGKKAAEEKAAAFAAEAKDVGQQLDELAAVFGPTFDCKLKRPYSPARIGEWLGDMRQYQKLREKGVTHLEHLEAEHPAFSRDERLKRLEVEFSMHLGTKLDSCLADVASENPASNGGRAGAFFQLMGRGKWAIENNAPHRVIKDIIEGLKDGAEGAEALATYREQWLGKKDPESLALARKYRAHVDVVLSQARAALEATRMPSARSTDSGLMSTATTAIKAAGYSSWERMVINSALQHVSTTSTDTREQGDYLIVTTYPRVYDEFQVCLAEAHGEKYQLVYYTIRKYSRGGSVTPIGRWLVADRIVLGQILKENISK